MPFKKGHIPPPNAGRPKGSPNKITREIKEIQQDLLNCFVLEDIEELYVRLKHNKPEALLAYLGKIAPKDFTVTQRKPIKEMTVEELKQELNELEKD